MMCVGINEAGGSRTAMPFKCIERNLHYQIRDGERTTQVGMMKSAKHAFVMGSEGEIASLLVDTLKGAQ